MIEANRICAACSMNWDHVSDECEQCGASADDARIKRPDWRSSGVA